MPETVVVFVHGNPECSYSFHNIIRKLEESLVKPCRVIAMDHIGFYRTIHDKLKTVWGPEGQHVGVRALFGAWDPLGKETIIEQWVQHLPQMKRHVTVFPAIGHFVNIEKPDEIAAAIAGVANLNQQ